MAYLSLQQLRFWKGMRKTGLIGSFFLVGFVTFALHANHINAFVAFSLAKMSDGYSVAERLSQYAPTVEARLRGRVESAGLTYPPQNLAYVSFKDSRRLEVYGRMADSQSWRFISDYPILAESGQLGPKLREGDEQIPEGIYRAESLNPNSRFHLSIRVNYPNDFDRQMAKADGRTRLGGDIMIHGNSVSIGCLAMGDQAVEDLFVLAALTTMERVRIVISPTDFRVDSRTRLPDQPHWVRTLYQSLRKELELYKKIV